ncbi:MAG: MATE family efflux transporter [Bacteroidales bacterium]|jgi:O-antigen/teichoic acid export membrane protein|nr:MATE family efflux transporter [Bacteroidales bacterium]
MGYPWAQINKILKGFIGRGHVRSIKAKKNILGTFIIKSCSIVISMILVPLTINYINPSRYGIWLTLSSIVAWFSFFDIGLTQGLRNKFAEAKAVGDDAIAQAYVSTTYAILCIIFFSVWLIFLIINPYLNWNKILNISEVGQSEISFLVIIVFTYFCLSFVFRMICTILTADQQPAKASFIDLLGQLISLIIVFILVKTTEGSLIRLGYALCISPLLVLIFSHIILFNGKYKQYRPAIFKVNFKYAKGLFNLGLIFFVIQIAGVVQYQTANIIIAQNFSTVDVTLYNIVYKYFGALNMVFVIFLTPFWSASTEAYIKNDISWIKNGIKKYNQFNLLLVLIGTIMLISSGTVYRLWLGEGKVDIPFSLSFWGFLFFNILIFGSKYVYFLNSINALRIQFLACLISPFLYVAFAIILVKYYEMGVYSLFIASILANFNGFILAPIQYYQVINKNKNGIWIK